MSLSFFNQRRAKEKEKQKLSASIDSAETLIDAKDENASLPHQEEEGLSLEPQPLEDAQVVEEAEIGNEAVDAFLNGETEQLPEGTEEISEQEAEKLQAQTEEAPKEETKKVSDAQKIKNAKNKANKTK